MEKLGALLPIWIIGAPLIFAIIERMRTPNPASREDRGFNTDAARAA